MSGPVHVPDPASPDRVSGATRVERIVEPGASDAAELTALIPELSRASPPDHAGWKAIASAPGTSLLVARLEGHLVGTLTLVVFRIPTGVRAVIEDVVVAEQARGRGIGGALIDEALRVAAASGARTVDLTSRPSREAANRLYERAGFARRETNVWRFTFA